MFPQKGYKGLDFGSDKALYQFIRWHSSETDDALNSSNSYIHSKKIQQKWKISRYINIEEVTIRNLQYSISHV